MTTRADIRGNRPHWLLDVTIGGRPYYFSDRPVTVTKDDGSTIRYATGLDPISWSLANAGLDASIGITLRTDINWAAMVAKGVPIERAPGILRRWFEGQTLERARVILRGVSQRVEYGAENEPLVFSLATLPDEQSRTLPPAQAVISPETWAVTIDSRLNGAPYPWVIGCPGEQNGSGGEAATPGLLFDLQGTPANSKIMIAGHKVEASTVTLFDMTDTTKSDTRSVLEITDDLGRIISYVAHGGGTFGTDDEDRKWYVGWDVGAGGMLGPKRDEAVRGAGELIRQLLTEHSTIPIDVGRMIAQESKLNRYKIDGFINRPISVWSWIQKEVLPLLPVMMRETSDGLFFQYLDWRATASDAVTRLDADTNQISRVSSVSMSGQTVRNEITFSYAPFATSQRYRERRVVTAKVGQLSVDPLDETDTRILADYRARVSQNAYGVRPLELSSSVVWQTATATRILSDKIAELALPKRSITYAGGPDLEGLEVGSVVVLNDSELSIADKPAILMDVMLGKGSTVQIRLTLIDDITQTPRLAG